MYYEKEGLERMRKEGEAYWKQKEEEEKGCKYTSEAGLKITCLHCNYDRFEFGKALLNTRGMSFFDLDWLNKDAVTLACRRCGFIHWFGNKVTETED